MFVIHPVDLSSLSLVSFSPIYSTEFRSHCIRWLVWWIYTAIGGQRNPHRYRNALFSRDSSSLNACIFHLISCPRIEFHKIRTADEIAHGSLVFDISYCPIESMSYFVTWIPIRSYRFRYDSIPFDLLYRMMHFTKTQKCRFIVKIIVLQVLRIL